MVETKSYRPRFVRSKKQDAPVFRVQERDIEILQLLADYRFLETPQILALTGRGYRNLQRRLQYMFHAGLVDRPPRQQDYLWAPRPMVYALGDKGADLLAERLQVERGKVAWQEKNRQVGLPFVDHTLMTSNFRATLTLATKAARGVELVDWRQGTELTDRVQVDGEWFPIVPDGFFTLKVGDKKSPVRHFFLESDRSTMDHKRFFRKVFGYWQWYKSGGHTQKLGIPHFRVLTLTISEQRRDNLRVLTRGADDRKKGSEMFLFACEKDFSLEDPATILGSIAQCPKDATWHSLIE